MLNTLAVVAATVLGLSPSVAAPVAGGPAATVVAAPISPTCTLNPFGGPRTCTNAPACFYDPLTGRHYCPDGRAGLRVLG